MRLYLIILLLAVIKFNEAKVSTSRSSKSKLPQNAIIAIQIIDPQENSTSAKNSKRTIESSLGYGYQGNFVGGRSQSKYEVYKYSQHDIPPFSPNQYTAQTPSYQVQNSAPAPVHNTGISNFYQPGTVLFSTINQQGQLGQLSSQFPASVEDHHYPIPVIILRVHPDQLANPLYPNLPQNHLHASAINSIDINSLLSGYIASSIKQPQSVHQEPVVEQQQYQQQQQEEDYKTNEAYVQPQQEAVQYQTQQEAVQYQPQQEAVQYQPQQYQTPDYQSQQYYSQYQYEGSQDAGQGYQAQQDVSALPEPRTPDAGSNYQYSNYQVSPQVYQQPSSPAENYKSPELLTDENYPSDKHTQIIFKRSKGKSSVRTRNAQRSSPKVKSTKTRVSSHQSQPQSEQVRQSSPKYYQSNGNYYTIQYSDDQGYTHQKTPNYGAKEQSEDVPSTHSRNYVYESSGSAYDPNI